jgi:rRNA maturation endonuclease Nob1
MATEIETEYTSKPFDRPVDRLFDNIITLEKLRDDYKNNELKTTSVELVLSDYKDENIADQVNININDILGNKYVTEIFNYG